MKYTNIKKLLIKFMGGGLINFPTRFLKWIKIDGDAEGDDGGDDGGDNGDNGGVEGNNIFFSPLAIQPSYYCIVEDNENNQIILEIQDISNTIISNLRKTIALFYSKEQIINFGINENVLNNLQQVTFSEIEEDSESGFIKCYKNDENLNNIVNNNYIINVAMFADNNTMCMRVVQTNDKTIGIYKLSDDVYFLTAVTGEITTN